MLRHVRPDAFGTPLGEVVDRSVPVAGCGSGMSRRAADGGDSRAPFGNRSCCPAGAEAEEIEVLSVCAAPELTAPR